jgi:mycothiol synthase
MSMRLERLVASDTTIEGFIDAVAAADGLPPLSEHKRVRLGGAEDAVVAAWGITGRLAAVSVAAAHQGDEPHWALEVATRPHDRNDDLERAAIEAAASTVPVSASLWVQRSGQVDAAKALGYHELRRVVRMDGPIPSGPGSSDAELGRGGDVQDFALIDVHNRAFTGHREASGLTQQGLDELRAMAWYDPDGVVTATIDGRLAGFCWTKLHADGDGEVYLLAVDPDGRGRGVGELLARAGFSHLRGRGAQRATLWVDGANDAAIALYRRLGLEPTHANVEMVRSG